jgi:hypothetical protein
VPLESLSVPESSASTSLGTPGAGASCGHWSRRDRRPRNRFYIGVLASRLKVDELVRLGAYKNSPRERPQRTD